MVAVLLALGAAFSWGFGAVFVRLGLRYLSTAQGTLVSLVSGLVFMILVVLVFQLQEARNVGLAALAVFGLIGTLNFSVARFLNYLSIQHLGVGRATPILAASPLFALVIAVVFTGEELTAGMLAGTALILAGVYLTLRTSSAGDSRR